jgi:tripartite-type tricarboxylate transporter receptor subunit TctC
MNRARAAFFAFLAVLMAASWAAPAAYYPDKPIRILVGFPAGSSPDIVARLLGQKLSDSMGKAVVVENVSGASGSLGAERVAKAPADGYTLALAVNAQIIFNPSLYKLSYDTAKDFAPVTQIGMSSNVLVIPNGLAARNLQELLALARAQPGKLTFATAGNGTSPHLAAELLKAMGEVDLTHVPYKGVVSAIPDLVSGRVTMMFSPIATVLPFVRDGKLRALGVTSLQRSPALPGVPSLSESGLKGFEIVVWYGLLAPAGTPDAIVRKLHAETVQALAKAEVRAQLADVGVDVVGNSPEDFAAAIKTELPKWAKFIQASGIKPD